MEKKILSTLNDAVNNGDISGASVMVLKNGRELAFVSNGWRDKENGLAMQRDTIFRLYSQTKPVTAAAAVCLMEEGKLDAGAWLSDIFPEYSEMYVNDEKGRRPAQEHITICDLLNMTSGLSYPDGNTEGGRQSGTVFWEIEQNMRSDHAVTTEEFAKKMASVNLCFEPGSNFMYGASADVLGAVIERVSGMSLRDYFMSKFFVPLGMADTDFYVPAEKADRLAKIYDYSDKGLYENKVDNLGLIYERDRIPAFQSGGAGLCSTLDDYSKFAKMLLNGGTFNGERIMSEAAVRFLTHGGLADFQKPQLQRGWGWMRGYTYGNLMRVCDDESMTTLFSSKGEYGWDGWAGTFFSNEPQHGITLLYGVQQAGVGKAGNVVRKIKNIVMSELT